MTTKELLVANQSAHTVVELVEQNKELFLDGIGEEICDQAKTIIKMLEKELKNQLKEGQLDVRYKFTEM